MRAYSRTSLALHVRDVIIKKMRPLPSRSSRMGRIRKASRHKRRAIRGLAECLSQNFPPPFPRESSQKFYILFKAL